MIAIKIIESKATEQVYLQQSSMIITHYISNILLMRIFHLGQSPTK